MQNSTIVTINPQGIVQSVDKNCCRLFGYELDELIGHSIKLIIPPPYKEQHDSYLNNYLQTKIPKIIGKSRVVEGQSKDGSIFPIRLSVSKIGEGDKMVFIGMIDKLEDKSASITINTAGIVVSCNQNVEDLFGYKANELIGQPVAILMPTPHKEKHNSYIQAYLSGGPAKVIGRVRNVPGRHKNGTIFPISMQVEQLKVGAIQLFRGKLEKVDLMEAVFTLDETGKVIACNQNFVQALFGYANPEIVGKNIDALIPQFHISGSEVFGSSSTTAANGGSANGNDEPDKKKRKVDNSSSGPKEVYSWKTPGLHKKEALHKDGSFFPVHLEIYPFQEDPAIPTHYSVRIKRAEMSKDGANNHKLIGRYYVVKTVGQGSYGKVKLAINKETKQQVAIKILLKSRMKQPELERTRRETEILGKLQHPNIAQLLDIIETEEHMNIVMEFAGRTLLSYVLEKSGLGESDARRFFLQILSAIKYCHDRQIIHRDIKHQNILLDEKNECKLIDFGLSNFMEEGKLRSTFCGTPAYAAPEMILGKKYVGPEVDIWSMGVVLYSMITGVFPFENVGDIIKGAYKDPKDTTAACCDLLKKMLQVDVQERATLEQICEHPWVKNEISQNSTPPPLNPTSPVKEIEVKVVATEDGTSNPSTPPPLSAALPSNGTNGSNANSNGSNGNSNGSNGTPAAATSETATISADGN